MGKHSVRCFMCDGSGVNSVGNRPCSHCDGSGVEEEGKEFSDCYMCGGTGRNSKGDRCATCEGKGVRWWE